MLEHLFPMLGDDPAEVIDPLPIVDDMGQQADFTEWSDSVLPGEDAGGALTFLWHLRALLTGNEDPEFWPGSMFFPLVDGPSAGSAPTMANAGDDEYPPAAPGPSAWVGVLTDPPDAFTLVIDLWNAASQQRRIRIAKWNGTTLTRPALPSVWPSLAGFGGGAITVTSDGLTLLSQNVPDGPLQGDFEIALALGANQPPAIVLKTPLIDLTFPPSPAQAAGIAADLTSTIIKAASTDSDFAASPMRSPISRAARSRARPWTARRCSRRSSRLHRTPWAAAAPTSRCHSATRSRSPWASPATTCSVPASHSVPSTPGATSPNS